MEDLMDLNKALITTTTNEDNTLRLNSEALPLPLRIDGFHSEREYHTFIKNVEKIIRDSAEYKMWISYIIDVLGHNQCVMTHERITECSIVVHHHPINLYTIVKAVINELLRTNVKFSTFDIALKVIELHYQNKVGYMLLLSNLHEKFHSGFQKLPIEHVNGQYRYLLDNYTIDEDQRLVIAEYCTTGLNDCKLEWTRENYPGLHKSIA